MRKFEVCLRGKNFLIKKDGKVTRTGFLAARFIEAMDMSEAVKKVSDSFKGELKDIVTNPPEDPPKLSLEEVDEVYYYNDHMMIDGKVVPGEGFLWDDDDDKPAAPTAQPISTWQGGWPGFLSSFNKESMHLHTICVHFSTALFPVALLSILLYLITGNALFDKSYFYMMILGTISTPIAYFAGFLSWKKEHNGAMIPIFVAKLRFGAALFVVALVTTLWRALMPGVLADISILTVPFIVLNLLLVPIIIYLGHMGGVIVYEGVD